MMRRIFISYKHSTSEFADRVLFLAKELRHFSFEVRVDQRSLAFGEDITKYMDKYIEEADIVLLLVTKELNTAIDSDGLIGSGVRYEISKSLAKLRRHNEFRFIPILLEDIRPAGPIANIKALALYDPQSFRKNIAELIAELGIDYEPEDNRILDGRYRVDNAIEMRGITTIYEGYDMELDTPVEIYNVPLSKASAEAFSQLSKVARSRANIFSPYLLNYRDIIVARTSWSLITERFQGVNFDSYLLDQTLNIDLAIQCAAQLCIALIELHNGGIFHCALVPRVIRLGRYGRHNIVKIVDFEFATLASEIPDYSEGFYGYIFSTPPERLKDVYASEKSDIYQLGTLLFWMITGRWLTWSPLLKLPLLENFSLIVLDQQPLDSLILVIKESINPNNAYSETYVERCAKAILKLTALQPEDRPSAEQALGLLIDLGASPTGYSNILDKIEID